MSRAKSVKPLPGESTYLDSFSIPEFCARNGPISRAHYYNMRDAGIAPREIKVLGRTLITAEAAREWRREREADTAAKAAAFQTVDA